MRKLNLKKLQKYDEKGGDLGKKSRFRKMGCFYLDSCADDNIRYVCKTRKQTETKRGEKRQEVCFIPHNKEMRRWSLRHRL